MHKARVMIEACLVSAAVFFVFYLLGAFTADSFDTSDWTMPLRGGVALFGGIVAGCTGLIMGLERMGASYGR